MLSIFSPRAGVLALAGVASGCILPNPAFDEPSASASGGEETATSVDSTPETSLTATSSTSTSASTEGMSGTVDASATDSTTDSTTGEETTTTGEGWICDLSPGAWRIEEPTLVEAINTPSLEFDPFLFSDGRTLYFSSDRPNGVGAFDTYFATRSSFGEPFGPATLISDPGWNQTSNEGGVTLRDDGLEVFLASDASGEFKVSRSARATADTPFMVWLEIPALTELHDPHLSDDNRSLYVVSDTNTNLDLAVIKRGDIGAPFGAPAPLIGLNTSAPETSPSVSDDERRIIFARNVEGQFDLFTAHRSEREMPFGSAEPLLEINTPDQDAEPFLAEVEGSCELYFSSDRDGDWAIYRAAIVEDEG